MDAIMGQTMGGILFSMLAGQPLIVIMTTAPIALYIKIIVAVADVSQTPSLECLCHSKNLGSTPKFFTVNYCEL